MFILSIYLQKNSSEVVAQRSSILKVFSKTSPRPAVLSKKRLQHRCFPVNFAKFLKTPFLQNTSGRLPLINGTRFSVLIVDFQQISGLDLTDLMMLLLCMKIGMSPLASCTEEYLEPCETSKMEHFTKHFHESLYLRHLTGF